MKNFFNTAFLLILAISMGCQKENEFNSMFKMHDLQRYWNINATDKGTLKGIPVDQEAFAYGMWFNDNGTGKDLQYIPEATFTYEIKPYGAFEIIEFEKKVPVYEFQGDVSAYTYDGGGDFVCGNGINCGSNQNQEPMGQLVLKFQTKTVRWRILQLTPEILEVLPIE